MSTDRQEDLIPVQCTQPGHWQFLAMGDNPWVVHPKCVLPGVGCPVASALSNRLPVTLPNGAPGLALASNRWLHKTPSLMGYRDGKVRGIAKHGFHYATKEQIEDWSRNPAYNILLRCDYIHAIDIDIIDHEKAQAVEQLVYQRLGVPHLPKRYRKGVGKLALFVRFRESEEPGYQQPTRQVTVEGGVIEFRASRAIMVLAGYHSEDREFYYHENFTAVPFVDRDQMAALWDEIRGMAVTGTRTPPPLLSSADPGHTDYYAPPTEVDLDNDPVMQYMEEVGGWALGYAGNGHVSVRCPWEHEHTTGTAGDTSTSWMPRIGKWKCMHGHCDGRKTEDFLMAIGYRTAVIEQTFQLTVAPRIAIPETPIVQALNATVNAPRPAVEIPLTRGKSGRPEREVSNLLTILRSRDVCQIASDSFRGVTEIKLTASNTFRELDDKMVMRIREVIERRYRVSFPAQEVSQAIDTVGDEVAIDSAQQWLSQQSWDAQPRIETFARDILKAHDDEYARALSWYLWVSQVARVIEPGVKVDMSVILISPNQGTGKSSTVQAMAPFPDWYTTVNLEHRDDDASRLMAGRTTIELAELRGLRSRDAEGVKAWLTMPIERWVPKYREHPVKYLRRSIFIGTSNRMKVLFDPTGNRRFLPIPVAVTAPYLAWPEMQPLVPMYWAEAAARIAQFPSVLQAVEHFGRAVHSLAEPYRNRATVVNEQWDTFKAWAQTQPPGAVVHVNYMRQQLSMFGKGDEYRIADMFTRLGWQEADDAMAWVKPEPFL